MALKKDDRYKVMCIISDMLDNPGKCEIYPTTVAYDRLEKYIMKVRHEAVGWAFAECCARLDKGEDPRKVDIGGLVPRIEKELNHG